MDSDDQNETSINDESWNLGSYAACLLLAAFLNLPLIIISTAFTPFVNLLMAQKAGTEVCLLIMYAFILPVVSLIAYNLIGSWRQTKISTDYKDLVRNRWSFDWSMETTSSISVVMPSVCLLIAIFAPIWPGGYSTDYLWAPIILVISFGYFVVNLLQLSAWFLYTIHFTDAEKVSPIIISVCSVFMFLCFMSFILIFVIRFFQTVT